MLTGDCERIAARDAGDLSDWPRGASSAEISTVAGLPIQVFC
jgi:hypothetical protein